MARRKQVSLFTAVMEAPWQIGVVFAAIAYIGLKFIAPNIHFHNIFLSAFAKVFSGLAGYLSALFLLCACVSFVRQLQRRQLLDLQKDLDAIRNMAWQDFEKLAGEVFRRNGFTVDERGGAGPDGGIDLVIHKDGKRLVVQCKRWKTVQVGVSPVRELYGVMTAERAEGCVFVTSGTYTEEAQAFARGKPIWLIQGDELLKLVKNVQQTQYLDAVTQQMHVATEVEAKRSADQSVRQSAPIPTCPKCGKAMVKRIAKKANAGSEFWGCSSFPKCRGIVAME